MVTGGLAQGFNLLPLVVARLARANRASDDPHICDLIDLKDPCLLGLSGCEYRVMKRYIASA